MRDQALTVEQQIRRIASQFEAAGLAYGHGTDNAYDEAAWLVLSTLGMPYDDPAVLDRIVAAADIVTIEERASRRIDDRVPLAYILNEAWFAGHRFFVDERVLVPRSPISELIANRFEPWVDASAVRRIADVGTGSACIAVAMAIAFENAVVDAIDVSADALDVAGINVERHALAGRVRLVRSDLFDAIADVEYELIVSNPPYVDAGDMAARAPEFRHEPELGLAAGDDGLEAVSRILRDASRFLTDNGVLVCEVGNSRPALEDQYPDVPFVWLEFEHGGEGVFLLTKADLKTMAKG